MPSTRPRIRYNSEGVCNACEWAMEKRRLDWSKRWEELQELCERFRSRNNRHFDVIVPYSGGKNGGYIAYTLREKLGMHPLCVTIRPPMEDAIGIQNIRNFLDRGFDHVMISPNKTVERAIDRDNFVNKGIPMHAFMIAVQTAIFRSAVVYDVPFVMFAEEGETEYGGSTKLKNKATYDVEDSVGLYLSGLDPTKYLESGFTEKDLYWYLYPPSEETKRIGLTVCHWSYFEDFVNYKHYLVAKEHLGLQERAERSIGTYDNFSATDTDLIWLYFYLMYLKFGFGRTTGEVGNDIRRGALTRSQGLNLVRRYDGEFPDRHIDDYLRYYSMDRAEFDGVLDRWANKELFAKVDGRWMPTFEPY